MCFNIENTECLEKCTSNNKMFGKQCFVSVILKQYS